MSDSPLLHDWMPIKLFPPETFETFEVLTHDGHIMPALWTGTKWWTDSAIPEPKCWRILRSRDSGATS